MNPEGIDTFKIHLPQSWTWCVSTSSARVWMLAYLPQTLHVLDSPTTTATPTCPWWDLTRERLPCTPASGHQPSTATATTSWPGPFMPAWCFNLVKALLKMSASCTFSFQIVVPSMLCRKLPLAGSSSSRLPLLTYSHCQRPAPKRHGLLLAISGLGTLESMSKPLTFPSSRRGGPIYSFLLSKEMAVGFLFLRMRGGPRPARASPRMQQSLLIYK